MQDFKIQALTDPQRDLVDHITGKFLEHGRQRVNESKEYENACDNENETLTRN